MNLDAMRRYARALREAAMAEADLVGTLILDHEAFATALLGRAERVENVIQRMNGSAQFLEN